MEQERLKEAVEIANEIHPQLTRLTGTMPRSIDEYKSALQTLISYAEEGMKEKRGER